MRIELTNKTHWRDDHIRAFLARGMKDERPDLCRRGAAALRVNAQAFPANREEGLGYVGRYLRFTALPFVQDG